MPEPTTEALAHGEGFLARINHPVFGAFIASWLIWNWEIPYTLIRGLGTTKETIGELKTGYLNVAHIWDIAWIPAIITAGYLLLGPIFKDGYTTYKDAVKALWDWADSLIKGLRPVPRVHLDQLQGALKQSQEEKNVYQRAYYACDNRRVKRTDGLGGEMDMDQIFQQLESQSKQIQEFQRENSRLNAETITMQERLKKSGGAGEK